MSLGGHDPDKVFAAYKAATEHRGAPTVILAKTVKGYGLGEAGEGKNVTHQQKKLNEEELREFRKRFEIPIPEGDVGAAPFYKPNEDSAEMRYLRERRAALGGFMPARRTEHPTVEIPDAALFDEFHEGTGEREVSTTMAIVRMLAKLLKTEPFGKHVVPIVPDEARTFGMEALFRQCGIYSSVGQVYDPVDSQSLLYYREAKDGQILEEGITEAGSMSSFIAAGASHATHAVPTMPFFLFYSMFGFQRIGDLIWAAADSRARGFMVGATAGRTTLAGEGLQHQDGQSHLLALPVPNLLAYDPGFAFEIAVILEDGIRRMYQEGEDVFYYLTVGNENYRQLAMPEGSRQGILDGIYRLRASTTGEAAQVHLFGSGAITNEVLRAQEMLEEQHGIATDVWSVTNYKLLRENAISTERWNRLHPADDPRRSTLERALSGYSGVVVAATDYMRALPDAVARFVDLPFTSLGTEGFGRSDDRRGLRDHFEVDARYITLAALESLVHEGRFEREKLGEIVREMDIDPDKRDPLRS